MEYTELATYALKAKISALPLYSNFHVGAALLCEDEKVFTGINIENSSYSLTICAERTAIFKALSEGERKFKAIAIASDSNDFCPPCGACRQVIYDFCGEIDIILVNNTGEVKILKSTELLPYPFGADTLKNIKES